MSGHTSWEQAVRWYRAQPGNEAAVGIAVRVAWLPLRDGRVLPFWENYVVEAVRPLVARLGGCLGRLRQ